MPMQYASYKKGFHAKILKFAHLIIVKNSPCTRIDGHAFLPIIQSFLVQIRILLYSCTQATKSFRLRPIMTTFGLKFKMPYLGMAVTHSPCPNMA